MSFYTPFAFIKQEAAAAVNFVPGASFFYDANQGSSFTDQSESGNNGTLTGTATHTTDFIGTYWDFGTSGTDNHYVSTGVTPTTNQSYTVNTVIIFTSTGNKGPIGAWANAGETDWARVSINSTTNVIVNILYVGNQEEDAVYTHSTFITGKAWMVTLSYDYSTATSKHWINGYNYANRSTATSLSTTAEFQVHRFPPSARTQSIPNYKCGSISFYENKVFTQDDVDQQLAYFSQYYSFDTAS